MNGGEQRPTFALLLSKWIDESGMTLRAIADACEDAGQKITYSYISKVRSGKLPPPSVEVIDVLAKVLGKDPGPLHTLRLIEHLHGEWHSLFWSLLALVMDPGRPLVEQLEQGNIRDLSMVLGEVLKGQLREGGESERSGTAERVVEIIAGRIRARMGTRSVYLTLFATPPEGPAHQYNGWWGESFEIDQLAAKDADYALRVTGETMADVGIRRGDILLIRQTNTGMVSGDLVLIQAGEILTARRYYEVAGGFRLEPEFLAGLPINQGGVKVVGIVRGMVREF